MLGQILLNRFKFLTLTEYEVSSTACTWYHAVSIYGGTHVKFYRESREENYKFSFPKNFSIKIIDFNDINELEMLNNVKFTYDNDCYKLTDIEIQNIFNYFEFLEKFYNNKCKNYCEQHNIPWKWIEKSHIPYIENTDILAVEDVKNTDTPFVEKVEINW